MTAHKAAMVDMSDPLQVAVKVTSVEGSLALLSQQVSQGLGNVQTQLSALQGDMREAAKQLQSVAATQHELQTHSTGMERLAIAIERSTAENMEWRKAHERENRGVSDSVQSAKGALKLVAWSGVFIIGLVVFTVQMQFDAATKDRQRIQDAHDVDIVRLERRVDKADAEREEMKRMRGLK